MKKKHFLFLLICLLLSSCCQDLQCPEFPEAEVQNWIPQSIGSSLKFVNNSNDTTIMFDVTSKETTDAYKEENDGFMMCHMNDCQVEGRLVAEASPTSAIPSMTYMIRMRNNEIETEPSDLVYTLGDFEGGFQIHPYVRVYNTEKTSKMERDSIISNLKLGAANYENVIVQTRNSFDTTTHYQIQKVYVSAGYGIVGFQKNNVLYFRED